MGKTEGGALWLDAEKTSPYDFYQYWRNVDDADVEKCLALLTFLPMDEVKRLGGLKDQEINRAKEVLAFEITKQVHGEEEANKAQQAARALFAGAAEGGSVPTRELGEDELKENAKVIDMMILLGLTKSRGEGRKLIKGGGVTLNGKKVTDEFYELQDSDFDGGEAMLKKGKKVFYKIVRK